jgi:alcohol dehydrogenase class IV
MTNNIIYKCHIKIIYRKKKMINSFDHYNSTEVLFGCGRIKELGKIVAKYGKNCLLVTSPIIPETAKKFFEASNILKKAGINVIHFDKVVPNPTTDGITEASILARSNKVDVVVGMGGGSPIDTAKAVAVEATHKGTCWDYLYFMKTQPTEKTLPIIAVTTTSGTGSHVTRISVISNPKQKIKTALFSKYIFPKVSIVDPELMLSMPKRLTAATGWDVFCHAFESYIINSTTPISEVLSLEAIKVVKQYLPIAVQNGTDIDARTYMAYADTVAGLAFSNIGTTLPHGISAALGGMFGYIMHGEALAVIYPEFMEFTYKSSIKKFATLARIFDEKISKTDDNSTAEKSIKLVIDFLKSIGLFIDLKNLNVPETAFDDLARKAMDGPDVANNPATVEKVDLIKMLKKAYKR